MFCPISGEFMSFVAVSIIENLAAKVIKSFLRFIAQPMTLLCSRGLYTTDKQKREGMEKDEEES